ncbi:hypothetical protein L6452_38176 [Arctium lappa]|uniref:Uncharacterized protein n=1 Tax=Arctium lappa TaxID=4217 RepID=A0ACB8Y511_ARCLA|nr:hypothetical protein L6452_38176 [Arctium lappa]
MVGSSTLAIRGCLWTTRSGPASVMAVENDYSSEDESSVELPKTASQPLQLLQIHLSLEQPSIFSSQFGSTDTFIFVATCNSSCGIYLPVSIVEPSPSVRRTPPFPPPSFVERHLRSTSDSEYASIDRHQIGRHRLIETDSRWFEWFKSSSSIEDWCSYLILAMI